MAFVPWGYFASKHISDTGRAILAIFISVVFFAFSIRAFVDREWDDLKISLILAGFFVLLAYGFWTDWNFKLTKPKGNELPAGQLSAKNVAVAKRIAEEAFGLPKERPPDEEPTRRTR